jgi:tetratricopeptide (TPR) repeat protein
MTTPRELAQELGIRTEELVSRLMEVGDGQMEFDSPLNEEQTAFLRKEMKPSGLLNKLKGIFKRKPKGGDLDKELYLQALDTGDLPPASAAPSPPKSVPRDENLSSPLAQAMAEPSPESSQDTAEDDVGGLDFDELESLAELEPVPTAESTEDNEEDLGGLDLDELESLEELEPVPDTESSAKAEEDLGGLDFDELKSLVEQEPAPAPDEPVESEEPVPVTEDGDIDLSSLFGGEDEPEEKPEASSPTTAPAASDPADEDVSLESLLQADEGDSAGAEGATPDDALGLALDTEDEDEDFDLQALLESSISPEAQAPLEDSDEVAPQAAQEEVEKESSSRSMVGMAISGVFALVLLAIVGMTGKMLWTYYLEHREGGDEVLYAEGIKHLEAGRSAEAVNRLGTLIRNYPNSELSEKAFFAYADASYMDEQYSAAKERYKGALKFQSQRVQRTEEMDYPDIERRKQAQWRIADCLVRMRDYENAVKAYLEFLDEFPADKISLKVEGELAGLYGTWGQDRREKEALIKAVGRYQIAMLKYPDAQEAVNWNLELGRNYMWLARTDDENAQEYWNSALRAYNDALQEGVRLSFNTGEQEAILAEKGKVTAYLELDDISKRSYQQLLALRPNQQESTQAYIGLSEIALARARELQTRAELMKYLVEERIGPIEPLVGTATAVAKVLEQVPSKHSVLLKELLAAKRASQDPQVLEYAQTGISLLNEEKSIYQDVNKLAEKLLSVVRNTSERAIGHYIKGNVAYAEGRLGDMTQQYQQAIALEIPIAEEELKDQLQYEEERAHLRIIKYLYVRKKDYREALSLIDQVIKKYPDGQFSPYAMYLKGECFSFMEKPLKAADAYADSIQRVFSSSSMDRDLQRDARFKLPIAHQKGGQYERAIEEYLQAIKWYSVEPRDPRIHGAWLQLAHCHRMTSDLDRAAGVYKSFLERFPDHSLVPQARLGLADCLSEFYDFKGAREQYQILANQFKGSATQMMALKGIAKSYLDEADSVTSEKAGPLLDLAEAAYQEVQEKFPRDMDTYFRLANLSEKQQDWNAAVHYLNLYISVVKDAPEKERSRLRMADFAFRGRQWSTLLKILEQPPLGQLKPEEVTRWNFQKAEAYRNLEQPDKAMKLYQDALKTAESSSFLADEINRKIRDIEYRKRYSGFSKGT